MMHTMFNVEETGNPDMRLAVIASVYRLNDKHGNNDRVNLQIVEEIMNIWKKANGQFPTPEELDILIPERI